MRRYGNVFVVAQAEPGDNGLTKPQIFAEYWRWYHGLYWRPGQLEMAERLGSTRRQPRALENDLRELEAVLQDDGKYLFATPQWAGHNPRMREKVWTAEGLRKAVFASQAVAW